MALLTYGQGMVNRNMIGISIYHDAYSYHIVLAEFVEQVMYAGSACDRFEFQLNLIAG